jgi:hypothetical protein
MLLRSVLLFGLLAVGSLTGCSGGGGKSEVVPPLEPVTGKVTIDGKPAERVNVTFFPLTATDKTSGGSGSTSSEGAYTLAYKTGAAGIPAGDYVALFSKLTQPDGSPIPEGKTAADANAVEQLPERYRAIDDPQNAVNVPKGGKTFDFNLRSK